MKDICTLCGQEIDVRKQVERMNDGEFAEYARDIIKELTDGELNWVYERSELLQKRVPRDVWHRPR